MRATLASAMLLGGLAVAAPLQNDEKPPPVTEKQIKASQENLKQIGIAFHAFYVANNALPVDIVDKTSKPLLSWRVLILPHVGEEQLFKSFKFDEPWDGEHNKKLIAKMPKIYAPIRVKAAAGMTYYQTFTGKDALFGPGKLLLKLAPSIPDGTSNTGMVFEAGEPVVWTKPQDMPFDAKNPLPKLGGLFDGECNVVFCDGAVRTLKKGADEKELKKVIMPADGEPYDVSKLLK
jgi:prepilin-type processing-associated H-X9-DG protein